MVTLEEVKLYLRIDTDFEDNLIEGLLEVAEGYLRDGVTDFDINYARDEEYAKKADLLTKVLVAELYNNRDSRNDSRTNFSYTVQSMMNQLKYYAAEEVISDENTGQSTQEYFNGRLKRANKNNVSH